MPDYHVGQEIAMRYTNAPVSPDAQYKIGQEVDIQESGVFVAAFTVSETDDTIIKGTVCKTAALPFVLDIDDSEPIYSDPQPGPMEYAQ